MFPTNAPGAGTHFHTPTGNWDCRLASSEDVPQEETENHKAQITVA